MAFAAQRRLLIALTGALALLAGLAIASRASADVLCKAIPTKAGACPTSPGDYPANTAFTPRTKSAVMTIAGSLAVASVGCEGEVFMKNTATGGPNPAEPVPIAITELRYVGCRTNSGTSCDVVVGKNYSGALTATDDLGNGALVLTTPTTFRVTCGLVLNCSYQTAENALTLEWAGGNPAALVANENPYPLVHVAGEYGCGTGAKLDATFGFKEANTAAWVATEMA